MRPAVVDFENILIAAIRMVRTSWKASVCVFLQNDDGGLRVRSADGISRSRWASARFDRNEFPLSACLQKNRIMEISLNAPNHRLSRLFPSGTSKNKKYILVPVSGESKVLGLLILGPFPKGTDVFSREEELRGAGALCAVISAHWRLYEWTSKFIPDINHKLRTPLTAVQGSIGVILGGMCGQVGSEVREMLEMARHGCERTVRAIENYLTQQTLPPTVD